VILQGRAPARSFFDIELAEGVTVAKVFVMLAALISLFLDQSFAGVYSAVQGYAQGTLDGTADEMPWASIGYNAFYYVMILLTSWLIDRFGRRTIFGAGHGLFGVLSLYLAITPSLHGFMIGRCLQGLAQGTFFVCSVITVLTLAPPKLRGYAFSIFSFTSLSGAASGSFIGGWFIDHAYWRGAFALYAVLAMLAGAIIAFLLDAPGPKKTVPLDLLGLAFAFCAFFGFQYVSSFGERRDWIWSGDIVFFGLLSIAGFVAFVFRQLTDAGFIDLRLFRIRNLAVGSVLGFGLGVPLFGANLFVQYTETSLGFPPSTAGALLTLRILAIAIVAPTVVLLVNADKIDVKLPVVFGFLAVPTSYALLAIQTTFASDFTTFAFAVILSGAGFACLFSPIANVLVRSLPDDARAQGIAIFKMVLLLGGSLAATGLAVTYDHSLASFQSLLAGDETMHHFSQIGLSNPGQGLSGLVSEQASVLAYADNSKWVALVSLLNLPLILLLKKPSPP
jgi:DHA2 family multidrug resistance protein